VVVREFRLVRLQQLHVGLFKVLFLRGGGGLMDLQVVPLQYTPSNPRLQQGTRIAVRPTAAPALPPVDSAGTIVIDQNHAASDFP
jgi:hypothetical protein